MNGEVDETACEIKHRTIPENGQHFFFRKLNCMTRCLRFSTIVFTYDVSRYMELTTSNTYAFGHTQHGKFGCLPQLFAAVCEEEPPAERS